MTGPEAAAEEAVLEAAAEEAAVELEEPPQAVRAAAAPQTAAAVRNERREIFFITGILLKNTSCLVQRSPLCGGAARFC